MASADPLVTEAARHLVEAGGKRFRPLLVALGAQFGDPTGPQVVPAAVVVELTHLATLYHDDVMDEAAVRRGAPSANSRWTNSVAILVGDYLFARAADIAAELGPGGRPVAGAHLRPAGARPDRRDRRARATATTRSRTTCSVIAEKTGSLIATSARFGGMFGGAAAAHIEALAGYGETIGVAFQLSDDLLDIASESVQSGKTPGTDLREGVPTLPVLYALRRRRLRRGLGAAAGDPGRPARSPTTRCTPRRSACCASRPALKRARETVRSYAEDARASSPRCPRARPRRALESLCDFIADRTS